MFLILLSKLLDAVGVWAGGVCHSAVGCTLSNNNLNSPNVLVPSSWMDRRKQNKQGSCKKTRVNLVVFTCLMVCSISSSIFVVRPGLVWGGDLGAVLFLYNVPGVPVQYLHSNTSKLTYHTTTRSFRTYFLAYFGVVFGVGVRGELASLAK